MASTKRSDGDGSIYQRHVETCPAAVDVGVTGGKTVRRRPAHDCKGPWVGVLVTGWREGKPIRRKVSGTSRQAVATKLRRLREGIDAGELPVGRVPTVEEWMTYWLDKVAVHRVRPSTLRGYQTSTSQYIVPLLGARKLDRLTPEHIAEAWTQLIEVGNPTQEEPRPLSSTTALQAHRILARALKVAQQRGLIKTNPATLIDAPSADDVEMEPFTLADAQRILTAAAGTRNAARWSVALALGLRQGEALGLTWEHVDLEAGTIAVRQALGRIKGEGLVFGPVKSRAGRRTVVIPAPLQRELERHRKAQAAERLAAADWWTDADLVFARVDGRPIDPKHDWQAWKDLLARAGVPDRRLHDARHTAATMMLAQGVDIRVVMEILGHARIAVTARYQHVLGQMHTDAAEKMAAALWGDG